MKACSKCRVKYPLSGFHKSSSSRDGRQNQCKVCKSKRKYEGDKLATQTAVQNYNMDTIVSETMIEIDVISKYNKVFINLFANHESWIDFYHVMHRSVKKKTPKMAYKKFVTTDDRILVFHCHELKKCEPHTVVNSLTAKNHIESAVLWSSEYNHRVITSRGWVNGFHHRANEIPVITKQERVIDEDSVLISIPLTRSQITKLGKCAEAEFRSIENQAKYILFKALQ